MKNNILLKVLLAILLAIFAGWLTGPTLEVFGIPFVKIYGAIGQLFLNALSIVVVPLICASIITGTARMGAEGSFGKLGSKALCYFIGTSLLAVLVGLFFSLLIEPGSTEISLKTLASLESPLLTDLPKAPGETFDRLLQILYKIVPSNILAAAAQGQILGLILFSLLFGFFITKIEEKPASIVLGLWQGIFQVMMRMTHFIMKALPIGVFGLVAKVVATTGMETVGSVALFFFTVVLSLATFSFIVLPALLFGLAGVNPVSLFRAIAPALFTAFSTSSSAAALPVTMDCVEKRIGISHRICSFAIPLGSSLSMSGTALYQCVACLFIAQVYDVDLNFTTLLIVTIMTLLTSIGMAGIPSASLISIVVVLNTIGVPPEGIALILAVERILDMCRTTVNILGNACCSTLIARAEGEKDLLTTALMPLPATNKVS